MKQILQKKVDAPIIILGKINFNRAKKFTRDKGHYTIIKGIRSPRTDNF